uniref:Transmembrane protein 88B n=1 Tax=Pseudonaja textilis TaxID=8673 RepID=A0A670Z3I5_PSETE
MVGTPGEERPLLPMERRSTCGCWAWTCLVVAMNSLAFLLNFLLMAAIFSVVLLPAIVVVYFGFQCHSRVLHSTAYYCQTILDDNSSSALIILGFVIMSPLIVVSMALYCSLARRLHLFLCFQPCARAMYKGFIGSRCAVNPGNGWIQDKVDNIPRLQPSSISRPRLQVD